MESDVAKYDIVTTWRGGMASQTCCHSCIVGETLQSSHGHVIHADEPEAPLFFDDMIPVLFVFLALVMLFFVISTMPSNPTPVFKPLPRIHLKNCAFRE